MCPIYWFFGHFGIRLPPLLVAPRIIARVCFFLNCLQVSCVVALPVFFFVAFVSSSFCFLRFFLAFFFSCRCHRFILHQLCLLSFFLVAFLLSFFFVAFCFLSSSMPLFLLHLGFFVSFLAFFFVFSMSGLGFVFFMLKYLKFPCLFSAIIIWFWFFLFWFLLLSFCFVGFGFCELDD